MPKFRAAVANKCKVCEKTVYPMEELIADNDHYHKPCFRCNKCNRTLSTGSYASLDGAIFCKPHFLQLFKQKGNYEEGFGKERYKNKWNGPNSKMEMTSGGQTVAVKDPVAAGDVADTEVKENVVNGSAAVEQRAPVLSNGNSQSNGHVDEDSTDGGVEEESGPISLQLKKSKLFEKPNAEPQPKQNTPGKLKSWQPLSSKSTDNAAEKAKPAPKKLNINWSARTQERAAERAENEQPLKFTDMGDVKTKFETGQVGKKEFKSEGSNDLAHVSQGKAQSAKDSFENRTERQYDSTKRKELEELKIARTLAAQRTVEKEDEGDVPDARIEDENSRYRELEEFKKAASAKQNLSKFESGAFSNVEQSEKESRKEVENILGSGKAANTLKIYESGEYEKKEYVSPVKQELGSIKADTSSKKNIYESGQGMEREYESEAKKELETIAAATGETRNKFESGELLNQRSQNEERVGELEEIRSVSAAGDKKNKFESGELIKKDFESGVRQEIQEMKTGASEVKSKYESGELIRTEFDSDAKKEVQEMATGAMDKKNKYETGELEQREYNSVARKEAEEVKRLASSSSIKSKYKEAVDEGNKVVTSKPVTIEKAPPGEDPFISRSEDEDFKVTPEDSSVGLDTPPTSPTLSDSEYVPSVQPKKMTNIEERFKKEEVEKTTPAINKIQMPTFEKPADDDDVNGDVPDEEEVSKLKEQMWPKNTTSIKSMFEAKEQTTDEPKEAPKPIDLEAEISDYDERKEESLQGAYEEEQTEKA